MIFDEEKIENEKLFKYKTASDILRELKNNVTLAYIKNIMEFNIEYRDNSAIQLIILYYAYYFGVKIEVYDRILASTQSRIILGLLLRIPFNILIKMSKNDPPRKKWILEELEYYNTHKTIRIDEICKNVDFSVHDSIILDYLTINYTELLLKYNKLTIFHDCAKKLTEMKDILEI